MDSLAAVLACATAHPWYADRAGGSDLSSWPVLRKTDLYERVASTARAGAGGVYYSRSGGTTSDRPLYFPADARENHLQRGRLARSLRAEGVFTNESVVLNLFPGVRLFRGLEIFTEIAERCGATVLPVSTSVEDEELLDQMEHFSANFIMGMPTRLLAYARYLASIGRRGQLSTVLFGGEFMQLPKRRLLEDSFGVKRFCGVYGSAELGIVAYDPNLSRVPVYRFPTDILRVEVLEPGADGFGRLVGTSLLRRRFPVIRYDTGDMARLLREEPGAVVVELKGRGADSFHVGDDYYNVDAFAAVLSAWEEFQIHIQFDAVTQRDLVRFLLVPPSPPLDQERLAESTRRIEGILEADPKLVGLEVAVVPPEALVRKPGTLKTPAVVDRRGR